VRTGNNVVALRAWTGHKYEGFPQPPNKGGGQGHNGRSVSNTKSPAQGAGTAAIKPGKIEEKIVAKTYVSAARARPS